MTTASTLSVEQRLARIEQSIEKLAAGLEQAPVMLSMATDSIDEIIRDAKHNGTDIDARLKSGLHLLNRLSDPQIANALNGLLDFVEQAPGLVSIAADTIDHGIAKANQGSVRLEDRIEGMTQLLGKMSNPEMLVKVNNLIQLADQGPGIMAMMMDSADEFMKDSSLLDPQNLTFLKQTSEALSEARNEAPAKVGGLFGLMRAIKDPARQRALGFFMNVLKNLGNKI